MSTQRFPTPLSCTALTLFILAATALPALSQVEVANFIPSVQGDVSLQRHEVERPVVEGDQLRGSDRLHVRSGSQVTIVCRNTAQYRLNSPGTYLVSRYCGAEPTRPPRSPGVSNVRMPPLVIRSPITALLSPDNLTIRWYPLPNATQYQVTLTGQGVNWTAQVNRPQVTYTGSNPLQAGATYRILITANGSSQQSGRLLSTEFTVLPPAEVARVRQQVVRIQALQLEPDMEAIGLAHIYAGYQYSNYRLNQLAIDILQARIDAGTSNGQIYLLQADNYLTMGLPLIARERYQQALTLAQNINHRERQAESYLGLGEIAVRQTEYANAVGYLRAAQVLYQELGDREQVAELQARIQRLSGERVR